MNISKLKLAWKYLTGGFGAVGDYMMDRANASLASVDPANKAKVQAALNGILAVLAAMTALAWFCPVKWQTAYRESIEAVKAAAAALEDLAITADELAKVRKEFGEAVAAWKGPDDATCVAE